MGKKFEFFFGIFLILGQIRIKGFADQGGDSLWIPTYALIHYYVIKKDVLIQKLENLTRKVIFAR